MNTTGYRTYLWQEQKRKPYYRIQTDNPGVARKLRRRSSCVLSGIGINVSWWQFITQYKSPKIALRSLERLTGQKVQKDAEDGVFVAYTMPKLTSKPIKQVALLINFENQK